METWADRQLASLREAYTGCWDIWFVYYPKRFTWHARPVGSPAATVHAESPDELRRKLDVLKCQHSGVTS